MDLPTLRIGIIGAGFSGTALSAAFHRFTDRPLEIFLFEKATQFGLGDAYRTPYPFHLLNVRAQDMSAFEDEPGHFVDWLNSNQHAYAYLDKSQPLATQFAPRMLYGHYLQHLLEVIQVDSTSRVKLKLVPEEVVDIHYADNQATLALKNQQTVNVDKVVLALGNNPPTAFPFPVSSATKCIPNSWDYLALEQIATHDPVLIVGTGLSMIDAVLTLYHQHHQGKIYAISRHGLLPLPHADAMSPYSLQDHLPIELRAITKYLRTQSKMHVNKGGDWRAVVNALRHEIPKLWEKWQLLDRKRFLRHALPYWNIHRHRVHTTLIDLLAKLCASQQLTILSGRIESVENENAKVKLRLTNTISQIETKWLINCMGPALSMRLVSQPLICSLLKRSIAAIDPLELGFDMATTGALREKTGQFSNWLYTLGPPAKSAFWESSAVPEIRKQSFNLVKHILNKN